MISQFQSGSLHEVLGQLHNTKLQTKFGKARGRIVEKLQYARVLRVGIVNIAVLVEYSRFAVTGPLGWQGSCSLIAF